MCDPVIRRVRRSIGEARNRGGMQAGMSKVTIDAADAERLCIVAEALTAPQPAPDVSELVEALAEARHHVVISPDIVRGNFIQEIDDLIAAHRKGAQP